MSAIILCLALSDVLSLVVAAKFGAIQPGPFATTVFDGPTNASMTSYPNEEALTSGPVLANVPVKRGQRTVLHPRPRSGNELRARERPSNPKLLHLASRKTRSMTRSVRRLALVIQIEILTTRIYIHTRGHRQRPHQQTCGSPQTLPTTRYVSSSFLLYFQLG